MPLLMKMATYHILNDSLSLDQRVQKTFVPINIDYILEDVF